METVTTWRDPSSDGTDLSRNTDGVRARAELLPILQTRPPAHSKMGAAISAPDRSYCRLLLRHSSSFTTATSPCRGGGEVWSPTPSHVWTPESHSRILSRCVWMTAGVFSFLAVIHKKRRKSQNYSFFQSPIKKSLGETNQSEAVGYFFCLGFCRH